MLFRSAAGSLDPEMPSPRRPAPARRGPATGLRRTFSSFAARNYRLYFFGDLVSHTGSWAQSMAEAWLVLELTDSPVAVGATFACRFAPVFCLGLWGGVITDRFDRRRLLVVTQTVSTLLALGLGLGGCAAVDQALEVGKGVAPFGDVLAQAQTGLRAGSRVVRAAAPIDSSQEHFIGRAVSAEILSRPDMAPSRERDQIGRAHV